MAGEIQDGALAALIARAAVGAIAGALLLLALGLVAEILRRRHRARRVLALLDLTVPMGVRTAIVSVLALLATFTGARPIGAADSVRGWLGQTSSTTTAPSASTTPTTSPATAATTTPSTAPPIKAPPVVTPAPADPPASIPAPTAPTSTTVPRGPVVLIPPMTITRPAPTPTTSTTTPRRKAATPRKVAPRAAPHAPAPSSIAPAPPGPTIVAPASAPGAAPEVYVVQRDDCLWSIAARRLGSGADGRAIDTAWRQIYAANRAAIGENPNLILIGLTLTLPPLTPAP
jgi:resuscitation-promoting factor RpfA